jgi:hypothetical protein
MTSLLTAVRILLREVARADARDAGQPELAPHLFEKLLERYDRDPVLRDRARKGARIARKAADPARADEAILRRTAEVCATSSRQIPTSFGGCQRPSMLLEAPEITALYRQD